jgi:hypothetical protein
MSDSSLQHKLLELNKLWLRQNRPKLWRTAIIYTLNVLGHTVLTIVFIKTHHHIRVRKQNVQSASNLSNVVLPPIYWPHLAVKMSGFIDLVSRWENHGSKRGYCGEYHNYYKRCTLYVYIIDILYTLDSASLLVKLKPRIFQRLPPFE